MAIPTAVTNKMFTEILHWFTTHKQFLGKFIYHVIRQNKLKEFSGSGIDYWEQRHKKFGARSVVNLGHPEEEFEKVTEMQKNKLFPLLRQELRGNEKLILDFGCGPGRFTPDLANIIHGHAIGAEPSRHLLSLAPRHENVKYKLMKEGEFPIETASVDVVWICLVLSIIVDENILLNTINEIDRVLRSNGLLFLVDHTTEGSKAKEYIKFRSIQTYQNYFNFIDLKNLDCYCDLGQSVSIMAGRRRE